MHNITAFRSDVYVIRGRIGLVKYIWHSARKRYVWIFLLCKARFLALYNILVRNEEKKRLEAEGKEKLAKRGSEENPGREIFEGRKYYILLVCANNSLDDTISA